ncbi:SLATT domain-containing protein [Virgibacillus sp. MSP4-1]|uniref:SLATT domain-containing protein n=1 Tax=Virgibacillus sp. MSP4-1 TaxID=2700081 RepID=UPI0003A4F416|nr:SLATT domain-containing protein [Virgibacillus sp. MSP4-1]QHS24335.1 SLATT domain-containing protein [Virgibacillus sp. MSP4-1]
MKKDYFVRQLAENGYNVIYGAKKHFSTYDMVIKMPGRIAFITLSIGIWQIYKPGFLYNTEVSLALIIASIIALTISQYNSEKDRYRVIGNRLIQIHNELRDLYYQAISSNQEEYCNDSNETVMMKKLMDEFYEISISKQIFVSDWIAHYKLFFQSQYEWIDEQKNFTWKDKIPLSFRITVIGLLVFVILLFIVL